MTLQQKVEEAGIDFGGSDNLPADRDALKNIAPNVDGVTIGEGSYVVFVGFMTAFGMRCWLKKRVRAMRHFHHNSRPEL